MRTIYLLSFAALSFATFSIETIAAAPHDAEYLARGEKSWADVRVLADDAMEGRRAGTPGHRRAAEYVAKEFEKAGLKPGGDDGWFQDVNLISRTIREENSSVTLVRASGERKIVLGTEAAINLRGNFVPKIEAPLVFVGHGLKLPQYQHDDLAGVDVRGKFVVAFMSAPTAVPGAVGAHNGSGLERWKVYRDAGAIGIVGILNPYMMDLPWERAAATRFDPVLALGPPEADLYAGMQGWVMFNPAQAAVLFEGAPHGFDSILATLKEGKALPRFDLPSKMRLVTDAAVVSTKSENVIGILPGADKKLRSEHIVLSAHLDHLGVASGGTGDKLYNGAMDNAAGIAGLLDIARELQAKKTKPRRSLVFAAVTAEESGLLGSRAYVSRAERMKLDMVANLNTDMFLPLFPLKTLTVFGLEESDLGADVRAVAESLGVTVQTDPQPLRNRFIRSDQYSFVRAGVPALALKVGFAPDSPEAEIEKRWFSDRYHAVGDDLDQPVDLAAMGKYSELLQRLTLRVADRPTAPAWNMGSAFFKPRSVPR
ncbi:MAG: M20/M25/M40 family metallo-hydrolase [Steroidobacteraceae bacterium]|nr:M20/M25/M40 family metallo-hydrolase [Steroidobacteraceae bacterium]